MFQGNKTALLQLASLHAQNAFLFKGKKILPTPKEKKSPQYQIFYYKDLFATTFSPVNLKTLFVYSLAG